jgi:hypothetical protein
VTGRSGVRINDDAGDRNLLKIKAYVFADRYLCPEFRRIVNNSFVDDLVNDTCILEFDELLPHTWEAHTSITSDRPILQFLVDFHCKRWKQCCEGNDSTASELPHAFVIRTMRKLHEQLIRQKQSFPKKLKRCYYEHALYHEKKACLSDHMKYNKEKDFGFFGKRLVCGNCSEDNDSGTVEESEDNDKQYN